MNLDLTTWDMLEPGIVGEAAVHALFNDATSVQWHYRQRTTFIMNEGRRIPKWMLEYTPTGFILRCSWYVRRLICTPVSYLLVYQCIISVVFLTVSRQMLQTWLHFQHSLQSSNDTIIYNQSGFKASWNPFIRKIYRHEERRSVQVTVLGLHWPCRSKQQVPRRRR